MMKVRRVGQQIGIGWRIYSSVLTVKSTEDYVIGTFRVKWFEVVYGENRGWISIYDTDKVRK
jgi:hypothetical protein